MTQGPYWYRANLKSVAVAEKFGFVLERIRARTDPGETDERLVFSLLRAAQDSS